MKKKRPYTLYDTLSKLSVADVNDFDPILNANSSIRLARTMRRDLVANEISKVRSLAATSLCRNRETDDFQRNVEDRLMRIRRDVVKSRLLKQNMKTKKKGKTRLRNPIEKKEKDTENRYFPKDIQFDSFTAAEEELLHILFPRRMWKMICNVDMENEKDVDISAGTEVSSSIDSKPIDDLNSAKLIDVKTSKSIASNHTAKTEDTNGKESCETDPLNALRRLERTLSNFETSSTTGQDDSFSESTPETFVRTDESALSTKVHPDMSLLEMSLIDCDDDEYPVHSSSLHPQVQPHPRYVPPPQPSPHPTRPKIPAWLRRKYLAPSDLPQHNKQQEHTFSHHQSHPKRKRRARLPRKKMLYKMSPPHRGRGNVSEYLRAGEAAGTAGGMNWLASLRGR